MNKKMNLNWSVDEITGNMPDISSMRSKEFQVKETSNTELPLPEAQVDRFMLKVAEGLFKETWKWRRFRKC